VLWMNYAKSIWVSPEEGEILARNILDWTVHENDRAGNYIGHHGDTRYLIYRDNWEEEMLKNALEVRLGDRWRNKRSDYGLDLMM
jgi:hypothetical protein